MFISSSLEFELDPDVEQPFVDEDDDWDELDADDDDDDDEVLTGRVYETGRDADDDGVLKFDSSTTGLDGDVLTFVDE